MNMYIEKNTGNVTKKSISKQLTEEQQEIIKKLNVPLVPSSIKKIVTNQYLEKNKQNQKTQIDLKNDAIKTYLSECVAFDW